MRSVGTKQNAAQLVAVEASGRIERNSSRHDWISKRNGEKEMIVDPLVALSIAEHHLQREGDGVIGLLMGPSAEAVRITVPIPYSEADSFDLESLQHLISLYQKVRPKYSLLGFYFSHTETPFELISALVSNEAFKTVDYPVVIQFDPTFTNGNTFAVYKWYVLVGVSSYQLILSACVQTRRVKLFSAPLNSILSPKIYKRLPVRLSINHSNQANTTIVHTFQTVAKKGQDVPLKTEMESTQELVGQIHEKLAVLSRYVDSVCKGEIERDDDIGRFIHEMLFTLKTVQDNRTKNILKVTSDVAKTLQQRAQTAVNYLE